MSFIYDSRRPKVLLITDKKKSYVEFAAPVEYIMEIKEGRKLHISLDFDRELRKLGNMKVTVISTVVAALGMVPEGPGRETRIIEDQCKNRDNVDHSLISGRILQRVLET